MIDISHKRSTLRTAVARGSVIASPETVTRLREGIMPPKGDVLATARAAGIHAAKRTSDWITFCHSMPLDYVDLQFSFEGREIGIEARVRSVWKTGVEMEALAAVQAAGLNFYDMLKPVDDNLEIGGTRLISKRGGKSDFTDKFATAPRAAILVISDSAHAGTRVDGSGSTIATFLENQGVEVTEHKILPDESELIAAELCRLADEGRTDLVFTTGGTGFGTRDVTPEAINSVIDKSAPGIAELMRTYGFDRTPFAMLSRQVAGLRGSTLIISVPGSTNGARESIQALFPGLLHAIPMIHDLGHSGPSTPPSKSENADEQSDA